MKRIALLALALLACSDSTSPVPVDLTGTWTSDPVIIMASAVITLELTDNSGAITGAGELDYSGELAFEVTNVQGSRSGSTVGLTMTVPVYSIDGFRFEGSVQDSETVSGELRSIATGNVWAVVFRR